LSSLQLNGPFVNPQFFYFAPSFHSPCALKTSSSSSSLKDSPTLDTLNLNKKYSSMHVLSNDQASQDLLKQGFQKKKQKLYEGP
jgi:hypothetical protein